MLVLYVGVEFETSGISVGARFGVQVAHHVQAPGLDNLMECVSWMYARSVLVFYVGGEFGMSRISAGARFVRGWGFELRGISGGVRFVPGWGI